MNAGVETVILHVLPYTLIAPIARIMFVII
jgi:hypothetical protein